MPPKTQITREMILDAAVEIARQTGAENITARTVAGKLKCSTQPIMYHFGTIEALKRSAYAKADQLHAAYLLDVQQDNPLLGIGMNYIRFAVQEPHLFRFLFQSGFAQENDLLSMIDAPALAPVLSAMQGAMGLPLQKTKDIFITLAMFVHGYASIIANNNLNFDEEVIASHLERTYRGAILAIQEENG